MMTDDYRAYLLRLWRVEDGTGQWRARLENIESGEAQGFPSLGKLIEYLQSLEGRADQPGTDAQGESTP